MSTRWMLMAIGSACCLTILAGSLSRAADWPGWRGPGRDGRLADFIVPDVWPTELKQQWKAEVGIGYASPVVSGDRVLVFAREGDQEVVRALNLADGRQLWSQGYPAPYKISPAAKRHGEGPKSTPAVAEGRLFTLGISGILSCWEADSGKPLWQHGFSQKFKSTWPLYGTATSPIVEAGRLIAHVGGHDDGALAAFEPQTGQVAWQWDGDGPGYTSPIVATLHGTRQLITQSQGACIGVSATDGSVLWRFPFETQHVMNIVTPVVAGDLVVFSGFRKGTMAYRLEKGQDQWSAEQVWHNPDVSMFMSSPVVVGERVLGLSQEEKGQFFCLDASSGETLWASDGRMGENAALLTAGDTVLVLTTGSELIAFKAGADQFQPLARYKVADTPTWAHPVILGKKILIRDQSSLALWTMGE
jgi:outer membrane protein assembly factor BamB